MGFAIRDSSVNDWGYKFVAYPTTPVVSAFDAAMARKENGDDSVLVFESKHDYDDNMDENYQIEIPGADAIAVSFSAQTSTEQNCDFVRFFQFDDETVIYGLDRYSGGRGGSQKSFPGVNGMPPLIIPSSQCTFKFYSDG